MRVIKETRQMFRLTEALRRQGTTIGFVPTMGALHDGHCALFRAARRQSRTVVVSIFVNPLQFGPREDFTRYPRDLKRDMSLAKDAGCDVVFAPDVSQIYPSGFCTSVEVAGLGDRFEGAARPGHFRGVATVVAKLLTIVQPTDAWFGQKDYQQAAIIQRMALDLNLPSTIRVMPTVREADGLAMSSRNVYLTPEQRAQAPALSRALSWGKREILDGERRAARVEEGMRQIVQEQPLLHPEYLAVADAKTLEPISAIRGRVVLLGAVRAGATRLIDNVLVDVP